MKYAMLFVYIFTVTCITAVLVIVGLLTPHSPPQATHYNAIPLQVSNAHHITAQELQPTIQGTQLQ